MAEIRIHENIFGEFRSFRRGIVVARNIKNRGHSRELEIMLDRAVAEAAEKPIDLRTDSRITSWNQAHRKFGSNPNKYPPAHFALLKRVQKTGTRFPFINRAVAIMNYNSIKAVMPVGGDDLIQAGEILELRFADGKEIFTPLSNPETIEHPEPGEIIYVVSESGEVMCRRWNWRNGYKTRITEETQAIVMNIDGMGEDSEIRSIAARDRVARMLEEFCQAEILTGLLSPSQPCYQFDR